MDARFSQSRKRAMQQRIAIMQPYFFPYVGYYRLFAATDVFVIYDCVQFPRRGWVHRNLFTDANGSPRWITVPLLKASQSALIRELELASDGQARMLEQLRGVPALN